MNNEILLSLPLVATKSPDIAASTETVSNSEDLLPKEPCLQALAALRHSKWFQVCFCFFFGLKILKDKEICWKNEEIESI